MGDGLAVERVVSNLNNSTFFGSKMQLGFSKQAFLADVQSPYQLPDGSNSFQGSDLIMIKIIFWFLYHEVNFKT